jgi:hypothetical protein
MLPINNGSSVPVAKSDGTKLAKTMKEQVCLNAITVESSSYSNGILSTQDTCNLTETQCSINHRPITVIKWSSAHVVCLVAELILFK